jgi:hypothetical protein
VHGELVALLGLLGGVTALGLERGVDLEFRGVRNTRREGEDEKNSGLKSSQTVSEEPWGTSDDRRTFIVFRCPFPRRK